MGELWELIKGTDPRKDPKLKGYLSYDWCRFRRDGGCYFSGVIEAAATEQAGYLVYEPFDRGQCFRNAWDAQEECGSSMPGPNAREGGFINATVPWSAHGQRTWNSNAIDYNALTVPPAPKGYRGPTAPEGPEPLTGPPSAAADDPPGDVTASPIDQRDLATSPGPSPATSPSPGHQNNPIQQEVALIGDLARLHAAGALTDEEFAAKNAEILKRI